jgi:hypothetical protein
MNRQMMEDERPQITVFESARVRARCFCPDRPRLIVTLDYLNRSRQGFAQRQPSSRFLAAGFAQLIVESACNDWFLSPDLAALRQALQSFTAMYDDVAAIGFSLGGYGALLLSRALHLRRALLVSPQFSIFPQRAPFETRFRDLAAGLDPALDDLPAQGDAGLQGALVFDPRLSPADAQHAALIRGVFPGLRGVAMPFGGHPAFGLVAEARLFGRVQALLTGPEISARALHDLHRQARLHAPGYANKLLEYAARKSAAVTPAAP